MIRYELRCHKRHQFEGWFKSIEAYERQAKRGLIDCPTCGSTKVDRAPMAPRVAKRGRRVEPEASAEPQPDAISASAGDAPTPEQRREMMRLLRKARDEALAKSEYVGKRFAEEARRIHHKETKARGIHGEATTDDVRQLTEEGVEVFPVPVLPDDKN